MMAPTRGSGRLSGVYRGDRH